MKMKKIIALSSLLLIAANVFCGFSDFTKTILNSCNDQKLPAALAAVGLGTGISTIVINQKKLNAIKKGDKKEVADYPNIDFAAFKVPTTTSVQGVDKNRGVYVKKLSTKGKYLFTEMQSGLFGSIKNSGTVELNLDKVNAITGTIKFNKVEKNYYWGRIATAVTLPVIGGYVAGMVINNYFKQS